MSGFIVTAYAIFFAVLIILCFYLWLDRQRTTARLRQLDLGDHNDRAS